MKNYLEQNADKIEVVGIKKIKMPCYIFNSKTIDLIDAEIVSCKAIEEITIENNVVKVNEEFNLIAFYPTNNYKYLPCFEKNIFDFQKVKSELMLYSLSAKPELIEENLFLLGNTFFFISLVKSLNNGNVGKDGYTPIKGIDYFDGKDGITPIKGIDYFDGKDGKSLTFADLSPIEVESLKGYTPIKGIDYFDGKDGITPIKGIDYFDGKDGKSLTFADLSPIEVESLKGYTPIKGIDYFDGKDGITPIKGIDYFDGESVDLDSINKVAVHFENESSVLYLNEHVRKNIIYFDKIQQAIGGEILNFENASFKDGDELLIISTMEGGNLNLNNLDETLETKEVLTLSTGTTRLIFSSELNVFLKV